MYMLNNRLYIFCHLLEKYLEVFVHYITEVILRKIYSGMMHSVIWYKIANISEVSVTSIIRVYQTTQSNTPQDRHLHTCHENLKSHQLNTTLPLQILISLDKGHPTHQKILHTVPSSLLFESTASLLFHSHQHTGINTE